IYTLLERELEIFREYLNTSLEKRGGLYLYINYWDLNRITIKNRILLLLISKIINRLYKVKIYIKLDLKNTYY
ncbi:uncharacterized protein K444DRAFT_518839, partial [Hyaloscypha bicolor E]